MTSFFRKTPIYLCLLPVFFVLHGVRENFGQIPAADAALLALYYLASVLVVALVVYIFFRDWRKTALITFILSAGYFFYGALQDFFTDSAALSAMGRYRFLIPALLLILIGAIVYCVRTKGKLYRLTFFLNLLFVIYISIEAFRVALKAFDKNDQPGVVESIPANHCDTCQKRDIWLLVFDSYASSSSLQKNHNFYNPVDSFLLRKGFSIQRQSRSNYNLTPFSMASILNMSYVDPLPQPTQLQPEDYLRCNTLIRNNQVTGFLQQQGYEIVNYSIFDLGKHPTPVKRSFLPLKTNLIKDNTLYGRVQRDMGDWLFGRFPFNYFIEHEWTTFDKNNHRFLEEVKKEAARKNAPPRFVYMHVYMPHRPYFFDRNGNRKADTTIKREFFEKGIGPYLDYMLYTNKKIEELVNTIQQNDPEDVIVFMGDHGHRVKKDTAFPGHFFANMNAVYFPDRDYRGFYDSISGVNQFRVILNKMFRGSRPLLEDSVILVKPASGQKNYIYNQANP